MLTTLLSIALATSVTSPSEQLAATAKTAAFTVFVPDEAALGYNLTCFETGDLTGKTIVHMTYVNKKAQNSFEILESQSQGEAGSQLKKILDGNLFAVSTMEDDTVVSIRKGKTDISLVGSQISDPSAKKMLERFVPFHP